MESNFRRALTISDGSPAIFVSSPITIGLYAGVALALGIAVFFAIRGRPALAPAGDLRDVDD